MKTSRLGTVLLLFALFTFAVRVPPAAYAQTYHLDSQPGVPFPFDPYDGAEPIVTQDASRQIYQIQDNTNDWNMLTAAKELDAMSAASSMTAAEGPPDPTTATNDSGGGSYTNTYNGNLQPLYGSNDLWLEPTNIDVINQQASLILHGTEPNEHYQLLSTNQLSSNGETWTLGEIIFGAADTNQTPFSTFNIGTNSQLFFRAHHANPVLAIQPIQDAYEPNPATGDPGQVGKLQLFNEYPSTNDLPVHYLISGTAQNGVDYSNLTGEVTIPASTGQTNIDIAPLYDGQAESAETVTLTIQQTNDYLVDPNFSSATLSIADSSITISASASIPNAIKPDGPPGQPAVPGQFLFLRSDQRNLYPAQTAYYTISGTASNGEDYATLGGTVAFSDEQQAAYVDVTPLSDPDADGLETVTVALIPTNSYLVDPSQSAATVNIADSSTTLSVAHYSDAIKPDGPPGEPPVPGQFQFSRSDTRSQNPQMTVYYTVSGTATSGEDYTLLSGSLVFPDGEQYTYLDVNPLSDTDFDGVENVTVTLAPTNSYLIDPNNGVETINISDSTTTVGVSDAQDAIETNVVLQTGQVGIFDVSRSDTRGFLPQMTVNYQVSGTASNGVDYQTLNGTVTFASGARDTNIFVQTLPDNLVEGDETVTLTIVPSGNSYFPSASSSNTTVTIQDSVAFLTVAFGFGGIIGLDYYALSNSLVASYNYNNGGGNSFSLARIYTNIVISNSLPVTNVVVTNWSGIKSLPDEVYLTTARIPVGTLTNSAGFTNGDVFFGSSTGIGWLSADSTRSNLDWCILTNSVVTNGLTLRGGICMDQTGTFSNHIIAVASSSATGLGLKGIWTVDSHGQPTLLAQINTAHLEGVTTLTNDVQKWGPWAGKIITGDEDEHNIYTVAANGIITTNDTAALIFGGIFPESFTVVPPNQSLYLAAYGNDTLMELPANTLTNYVGDLLISQAGEGMPPGLFIVRWDNQNSNFVAFSIPLPSTVGPQIEDIKFAPIQLPGHY